MSPRPSGSSGAVLVCSLLALSLEACSTGSTASTSSTIQPSTPACSDGPRYPPGATFASEDASAPLPACVPHCGSVDAGSGGAPTIEALPSGVCSPDEPACSMLAEQIPSCPSGQRASGPISGFVCRCSSGAWRCGVRDQGGKVAACTDAGP